MTTWILLNAALKGTIVLGAAWLLTIALPFLSIGRPVLRLPARASELVNASGIVFRVVSTVAPEAPSAPIPAAARSNPAGGGRATSAIALVPWIWAFGVVVLVLQTAIGYAGMWRKRRAARPFD